MISTTPYLEYAGIVNALLATEHNHVTASVLVLTTAMKGFYNAVTTFSDVQQDLNWKLNL